MYELLKKILASRKNKFDLWLTNVEQKLKKYLRKMISVKMPS